MCGIWAIFGSGEDVAKQCLSCLKISHRGPDSFRIENVNNYPNCCFGFHRLSIIGDHYGMQPMRVKAFPHLWLCYNGEIYNYKLAGKQLNFQYQTESDGEVIMHLYNKGGAEFAAQHLDGVFAFCLLDTRAKRIYISRDTFGVKPCFTLHLEDGFLGLCSEAKGLVGLSANGHKLEGKTQIFPPGHIEAYGLSDNGKAYFLDRTRFHTIGKEPLYSAVVTKAGNLDMCGNIRNLLKAAVKKRLMSDRRMGCLLSGGLDSSLIAGLVVQLSKEEGINYPIQTFSIGMEGSPDIIAARKVANHIGSEHHEVIFTADDCAEILKELIYHLESYDITTIRASIGMYLLSKYIKKNTENVVIFSGEGSDEVAQGYIYFHKAPSAKEADTESKRLCEDLHLFDVCRADRTTSAWGLEVRVPFLDHMFTSYYLSLPAEERQPQNGIEKYALRKAFEGLDLIPDDVLWRPKEAFSDGVTSQKKSLFVFIQEIIETEVSDTELADAASVYPFNTPHTKEAYYYRKVFEGDFKGHSHWTPYYWLPKWSLSDDPSARTLTHYKQL